MSNILCQSERNGHFGLQDNYTTRIKSPHHSSASGRTQHQTHDIYGVPLEAMRSHSLWAECGINMCLVVRSRPMIDTMPSHRVTIGESGSPSRPQYKWSQRPLTAGYWLKPGHDLEPSRRQGSHWCFLCGWCLVTSSCPMNTSVLLPKMPICRAVHESYNRVTIAYFHGYWWSGGKIWSKDGSLEPCEGVNMVSVTTGLMKI